MLKKKYIEKGLKSWKNLGMEIKLIEIIENTEPEKWDEEKFTEIAKKVKQKKKLFIICLNVLLGFAYMRIQLKAQNLIICCVTAKSICIKSTYHPIEINIGRTNRKEQIQFSL